MDDPSLNSGFVLPQANGRERAYSSSMRYYPLVVVIIIIIIIIIITYCIITYWPVGTVTSPLRLLSPLDFSRIFRNAARLRLEIESAPLDTDINDPNIAGARAPQQIDYIHHHFPIYPYIGKNFGSVIVSRESIKFIISSALHPPNTKFDVNSITRLNANELSVRKKGNETVAGKFVLINERSREATLNYYELHAV